MRSTRSAPALANLKWNSLKDRRNKHIFKLVNLCLEKKTPQFLHNYFSRSTRQSNILYLPMVRTEAGKKSFFYNGGIVFNNLRRSCDGL